MEIVRLLQSNGSFEALLADWTHQCGEVGDCIDNYAPSSLGVIRRYAEADIRNEWAVAVKSGERFMATAYANRTIQKPFEGHVLRVREVTVCPILDYGHASEADYADTLIYLLNGAVKLSESELMAKHIKLHLRSPADSVFFRALGNTLDSKGVFASTESHGAWLTITKQSPIKGI